MSLPFLITDVIHFFSYIYKFLGRSDGDFGTLREVIKKNMINTKIVRFHYAYKQRCIVFEIFELVNQQFLARDVYIIFFLIIFVFIVVNSYSHFFFLI